MLMQEGSHTLEELVVQKAITPRDVVILLMLSRRADIHTGRIAVTTLAIAEALNLHHDWIRACFSRLKKQRLLKWIREKGTGSAYYLLNPWMFRFGKAKAVATAMKQFQEA